MQLLLFPSFRAEFSVSKVVENEFVFGQTGFVVETAHQVEPARKERFGLTECVTLTAARKRVPALELSLN